MGHFGNSDLNFCRERNGIGDPRLVVGVRMSAEIDAKNSRRWCLFARETGQLCEGVIDKIRQINKFLAIFPVDRFYCTDHAAAKSPGWAAYKRAGAFRDYLGGWEAY